jgi:uncharacterized Zn-finger protein
LDRYKYKGIDMFIKYKYLADFDIIRYDNKWTSDANDMANKLNKIETNLEFDDSSVSISFNQEKPSSDYNFEYYFNIKFDKI